ncbi:MAG TPA: hypothetical protein DCX75_08040 [Brevundimonas sp.]|jgi:hypothetical protein|nr:hypothetical protein [Brevundimonas sp.]MAL89661.1 hypothetical protein [Brevundimonas sp.]HAJ03710.1 hypothetical protein [Brevundimonas sp.]HAV50100.1 hypothetical protein [Brevundimonas sp.]
MIRPMNTKVVKRASVPPSQLGHRWYLAEWAAHLGKIQADAQRDLGWPRAKASDLWNNKQRYTQESVDEAAAWLGLAPYELLLPPDEAIGLRQLREAAHAIIGQGQSKGR